jgi:hypothetical protein
VNALVTLLDHEHADAVRAIWWDLESEFGITTRYVKPFVHFSYHVVADEYDLEHLGPTLDELSEACSSFTVKTTKADVFLGAEPVVFVSVTRSPELDRLHKEIWARCTPGFGVGLPYYSPEVWVPHITLAQGPRAAENLPEIMKLLDARDLAWDLQINNLAVIEDGGQERGLLHEVDLSD